jgi:hypothetical protein
MSDATLRVLAPATACDDDALIALSPLNMRAAVEDVVVEALMTLPV